MTGLAVVAAVAENGVIGRDNRLIWRLKSDLKRFRALTWGRPLIMGRKTWQSIGRPLPGRETVVLTRDPAFAADGARTARSFEEALEAGRRIAGELGADAVMVVGGSEVYRLALPLADRLHLTLVHASPEGDAVFPAYDASAFREAAREARPAGPDDEHPFTFLDLERAPVAADR